MSYLLRKPVSNYINDEQCKKCLQSYINAQAPFTGSGKPYEDGVGLNRSIIVKDKVLGPVEGGLINVPPRAFMRVIQELKNTYKRLRKRLSSGSKVEKDNINYHFKGNTYHENRRFRY